MGSRGAAAVSWVPGRVDLLETTTGATLRHRAWVDGAVVAPAGRARVAVARWLAAGSGAGARLARRLDEGVAIDLGPERLVRDA